MASDSDSDYGQDDDMDDSDEGTHLVDALVEAAANGNLGVVMNLLDMYKHCLDIDGMDEESGHTALQVASYQGHDDIVSFLLECGADVHYKGRTGYAPILGACENGADKVISVLLSYGANVHERDPYNKTPIYMACGRVTNDTIKMLLALGANSCDKDFPKFNPLNPACESGHYEVVQTLFDHGASMNGWDIFDRTPLQSACYGAYQPTRWYHVPRDSHLTVKILLERGADPNTPSARGYNTFEVIRYYMNQHYDAAILSLLLDYDTGSGVPCSRPLCDCNTTALMCLYSSLRRDRLQTTTAPRFSHLYDNARDSFEMHFLKTRAAGRSSHSDEFAVETPVEVVDWSQLRREAYRSDCQVELNRMKTETIGNTTATYFDLLTTNLTSLRDQQILRKFTADYCIQHYPIYGNMIYCSYVRLRMFFMVEECTGFFSILSPPLLPECVEEILKYLSNNDMDILVDIYRAHRVYSDQLSSDLAA